MTLITNDREAFEFVRNHLLTQNEKSIADNLDCLYRGYSEKKIEELKVKAGEIIEEDEEEIDIEDAVEQNEEETEVELDDIEEEDEEIVHVKPVHTIKHTTVKSKNVFVDCAIRDKVVNNFASPMTKKYLMLNFYEE